MAGVIDFHIPGADKLVRQAMKTPVLRRPVAYAVARSYAKGYDVPRSLDKDSYDTAHVRGTDITFHRSGGGEGSRSSAWVDFGDGSKSIWASVGSVGA